MSNIITFLFFCYIWNVKIYILIFEIIILILIVVNMSKVKRLLELTWEQDFHVCLLWKTDNLK